MSDNEKTMAAPIPQLTFDAGTLLLVDASERAGRRLLPIPPWRWDRRVGAWRCDAMHYAAVTADFRNRKLPVHDRVPEWEPVRWSQVNLPPLRQEQTDAVSAWQAAGAGMIVMPTGAGKTEVALSLMRAIAAATLVVCPVRDLMYQWHQRILAGLGYDAGIIGDNTFNVRPVSVTTYDSACIHMERLGNRFKFLIFDECHHLPGDLRRDAGRMSAAPNRLGLTATPERSDGRHLDLDDLIGPIVYDLPLREVRGKTLADYDVVRIPVHLSETEQTRYDRLTETVRLFVADRRRTDKEFTWEDVCRTSGADPEARHVLRAYYARKAIEDRAAEKLRVLEDLFRLHAGSQVLVFAGSNAMARDVSRRFLIPCLLNHCGKRERAEILAGFREGLYPALVANQVLDEGVDLPEVKVAVVIGGQASTRQAKQRLGRVLRKVGARRATLYEVVCADTKEELRSRRRRSTDAYQGARHRRL